MLFLNGSPDCLKFLGASKFFESRLDPVPLVVLLLFHAESISIFACEKSEKII